MTMRTICGWCVVLALVMPGALALAQGEGSTPDLLRGAIDPYEPVEQRGLFLRAAGMDYEMTREKFEADRQRGNGFIRPFDSWEAMVAFDRNGNGTIDWFEAEAYRQDVRRRVIAHFDRNSDGRLSGEERAAANAMLAQGRLPAAARQPAAAGSSTEVTDDDLAIVNGTPAAGGGRGGEGRAENRARRGSRAIEGWDEMTPEQRQQAIQERREQFRQQIEARRQELIERYDKDGDGELNEAERAAMRRDMFEQAWARRHNPDGGELSEEQRAAMNEARERLEQARAARMAELLERYDKDGDGVLSEEERAAMREDMRRQWQERAQQMRERAQQRREQGEEGEPREGRQRRERGERGERGERNRERDTDQ